MNEPRETQEHQRALIMERIETAAGFIDQLPLPPPSVEHVTVTFTYDDGHTLTVVVKEREAPPNDGHIQASRL